MLSSFRWTCLSLSHAASPSFFMPSPRFALVINPMFLECLTSPFFFPAGHCTPTIHHLFLHLHQVPSSFVLTNFISRIKDDFLRFPKIGLLQIIHVHRIFHFEPSILGIPIYGTPHIILCISLVSKPCSYWVARNPLHRAQLIMSPVRPTKAKLPSILSTISIL